MLAASPVTASIAVTSLDTIFSAVRFSSTFAVLSCMSLFLHPASASEAARMSSGTRMVGLQSMRSKKKRLPASTGSLLKSQRPP